MKVVEMRSGSATSTTLPSPRLLRSRYALSATGEATVRRTRAAITKILSGDDPRLLVVVGPCSIHDADAALQYAEWLRDVSERYADRLLLVMRAYVEKARTRLGWKGLVHDPRLDGSERMDEGLAQARALLAAINDLGVPVATEFLEPVTPAYLADTVSWAAIGARTSESPVHRELASQLECPVGFKNTTAGDVAVAINAAVAARQGHRFVTLDDDGRAAIVTTHGNDATHIILRGGPRPNYDAASIAGAADALAVEGLPARLVVDCSHGNCGGDFRRQLDVATLLAEQIHAGSRAIAGVMIESHLVEGRQVLAPGEPLIVGQSITDPCLGPGQTLAALDRLSRR